MPHCAPVAASFDDALAVSWEGVELLPHAVIITVVQSQVLFMTV